jgi:outer membrane beta-barrel protein
MRRCLLIVAVLAAPLVARAEAQPDIETDAPRVFSIQPRPYRLGHEFSLGLGVLPLDAFYKGMVIGAAYTYHFSDFWAWEMANLNYSLNIDTGLQGQLLDKYGVRPVDQAGGRVTLIGTTNLVVKPLFGKFSAFNISKVFAETYFVGGGGPIRLEREGRGTFYFTADLGVGIRFWVARAFSLRFDVRDYLIFNGAAPSNALMFMLSASFNYFTEDKSAVVRTEESFR